MNEIGAFLSLVGLIVLVLLLVLALGILSAMSVEAFEVGWDLVR